MKKAQEVAWTAAFAALAWLVSLPGCAERKSEGGACVFNDDCADPLICAGAFCRAQCRTNRDCPAGWICHNAGVPGKQVCLPPPAPLLCSGGEDCPASAACTTAHECRWRCALDPDCQARRPSLSCAGASVCNAPILVVELELQPRGDAGAPDVTPADDVLDAPTIDAPTIDAPTIDAPTIDAPPIDAPTVDAQVDAPSVDATDAPTVDAAPVDATPRCGRDFQCDDGVFCNGAERCNPSDPAADARGCAPPDGPRCMAGQRCDERMGRCLTMCEIDGDADDDGFNASMCGGPDCDDTRASVRPGAPELCNGVDDDCDRMTDEEGAALCPLRFATAACRGGACAVASCAPGHGDCDLVASNGCETELAANPTNCGACGRLCALTTNVTAMTCAASTCSISTCQDGTADCDGASANGCELDVSADVNNCGRCGARCTSRPFATARCAGGVCGIACAAGRADCDGDAVNGCETDLTSDRANCGRCGTRCAVSSDACVAGSCLGQPFASSGAEGAFAPLRAVDAGAGPTIVTLSAGVHHFTTVTIPAGVTVVTDGDGVLEIRATGDVVIDGTIDLSGSDGAPGSGGVAGCGSNGGGGWTGRPNMPATTALLGMCAGSGGGGAGSPGANQPGVDGACGRGGVYGGGAGGAGSYGGGGGGGVAGGGGASNGANSGGAGASIAAFGAGGNAGAGAHPGGYGGESIVTPVPPVFRGADGVSSNGCNTSGSGGGGSIGARAAADLAVADRATFRAGSGGGGGSGSYSNCNGPGAGGGGGGGGALRVASSTRIVVRGSVLARGGAGGGVAANGGGTSGSGGGGSGGLIYLSAPALDVISGTLSVAGGSGSQPLGCSDLNGGRGGLGRLRLSVLPSRCSVTGTWTPPLPAGGCVATTTPTPGQVYIGVYPD